MGDELFAIEGGFWLNGEDHFLAHLDDRCLLAFPQASEMHDIYSREDVAASASTPGRWRDLAVSNRLLIQPSGDFAVISYRADVTRFDGTPYTALVSSGYVHRDGGWKLVFHQHSPV